MDPIDLRNFANREWQRIAALKRERWRKRSPQANFRIAGEIYRQVGRLRPRGPRSSNRREDLTTHQRLSALLRVWNRDNSSI